MSALSPYVFDATAENFNRLVLENSHKGPVLVHFWTPKAGPCFILMPRLVKLATEYGGKFLLVMLNADDLPELARRFGVNSVPTVKFFWRGEVAHTIHGADPDSSFREILDRFIAGDANRAHALGVAAWQSGKIEQARMLLANAALAEPDNLAIPRDLAKLLWAEGEGAQALALLDSLPPEARSDAMIAPLLAHLRLAETARQAPPLPELDARIAHDGKDLDARYQRAAVLLAADDFAAAMEELLAIARTDRQFCDDLGRTSLLALFDLLGGTHPLTRQYRQALSESLHYFDHPAFDPYLDLIDVLDLARRRPSLDALDALAAARSTTQARGLPLRFVAPDGRLSARDYETHILHTGEVPTRANTWHDVLNALVWLRFPRFKAALNAAHGEAIAYEAGPLRGPRRDALTVLDESGVWVISRDPALPELLGGHAWHALFWEARARVERDMRIVVVGHALLEKALAPYASMTGKCLMLAAATLDPDASEAQAISALASADSPRRLAPLPIQGVPGWDPANGAAAYYANRTVFRPAPS